MHAWLVNFPRLKVHKDLSAKLVYEKGRIIL